MGDSLLILAATFDWHNFAGRILTILGLVHRAIRHKLSKPNLWQVGTSTSVAADSTHKGPPPLAWWRDTPMNRALVLYSGASGTTTLKVCQATKRHRNLASVNSTIGQGKLHGNEQFGGVFSSSLAYFLYHPRRVPSILWKRNSLSFPWESSKIQWEILSCWGVIFKKNAITSQSMNTTRHMAHDAHTPNWRKPFPPGSLSQIPWVFPDFFCVFTKFPEFTLTGKLETYFQGFPRFPDWLGTLTITRLENFSYYALFRHFVQSKQNTCASKRPFHRLTTSSAWHGIKLNILNKSFQWISAVTFRELAGPSSTEEPIGGASSCSTGNMKTKQRGVGGWVGDSGSGWVGGWGAAGWVSLRTSTQLSQDSKYSYAGNFTLVLSSLISLII